MEDGFVMMEYGLGTRVVWIMTSGVYGMGSSGRCFRIRTGMLWGRFSVGEWIRWRNGWWTFVIPCCTVR